MSHPATETATPVPATSALPNGGTTRLPNDHRPAESSPYLAARREWDERYGSLITRARNWRAAAFLALIAVIIETGGLIALAMKAKVVPFVVAVDSLGRVAASGAADQASVADDRLKR